MTDEKKDANGSKVHKLDLKKAGMTLEDLLMMLPAGVELTVNDKVVIRNGPRMASRLADGRILSFRNKRFYLLSGVSWILITEDTFSIKDMDSATALSGEEIEELITAGVSFE